MRSSTLLTPRLALVRPPLEMWKNRTSAVHPYFALLPQGNRTPAAMLDMKLNVEPAGCSGWLLNRPPPANSQ
jgi:hypothetical protein